MNHVIVSSFLVGFMALVSASGAVDLPGQRADGPHPNAPPETAQFGFLVGTWHCTSKSMRPDGSYQDGGTATWTGAYVLDGYAIQDVWAQPLPNGKMSYGFNIRSFDPETGKWDNRWLAAGSQKWTYFEAEKVGDTMVMTGGEGKDPRGAFVDRNIFYDIEADSWRWRKDRSYDGGKTWIQGVAFIEARRAGTAEGP